MQHQVQVPVRWIGYRTSTPPMVTTLQFQELSYYYCYGFSFVKLQPIFLIKKNKGAKYIEIMCH